MSNLLRTFVAVVIVVAVATAVPVTACGGQRPPSSPAGPFDPTRDAASDLSAAIAEASRTGKRVLVDVGGNWCSWCLRMERFVEAHPDLAALRDKYFVTVKVNYSAENTNRALLSKYPAIPGYPHLFVLDGSGRLLQSQDTSALEDGKTYSLQKFPAFLKKWGTS